MSSPILQTPANSIVLVTADPGSVQELVEQLESMGYDAIVVKDGSRALNLSLIKPNNWKPSLFLVDLIIPGESGFIIATHLLQKYNDGKIPVILMSHIIGPEDRAESSQTGAIALLQKPVTVDDIKETIEKEKAKRAKNESAEMSFKFNY